jgi:hypothetical protein
MSRTTGKKYTKEDRRISLQTWCRRLEATGKKYKKEDRMINPKYSAGGQELQVICKRRGQNDQPSNMVQEVRNYR